MNTKDNDEKIRKLIAKVCNIFVEEEKCPSHICFDIPDSSYLAHHFLMKDLINKDEWRLQVGVMEDGTDKMFSHYLNHDTKENMLELLKTEELRETIFDSIKTLYARAQQDD